MQTDSPEALSGGVWALPLLALGLGLVACCCLVPAAEETRLVLLERERLKQELAALERQVTLNSEFLDRLHSEPNLALRLAARQRARHEPDVAILAPAPSAGAGGLGNFAMSPFALVAAEPAPAPSAPPPAVGGMLASLCRDARSRLVVLGAGLFVCVVGLVTGGSSRRP